MDKMLSYDNIFGIFTFHMWHFHMYQTRNIFMFWQKMENLKTTSLFHADDVAVTASCHIYENLVSGLLIKGVEDIYA